MNPYGSPLTVAMDFLGRNRVPLLCAAMVLFYFGRANYNRHLEHQYSLEKSREGIVHVETQCATLRGGRGCSKQVDRLLSYCAENINGGEEGSLKPGPGGSRDYELHYVALTIRHGDRSAIHSMPGSLPYFDPDDLDAETPKSERKQSRGHAIHGTNYLDARALAYLPRLSSFEVKPLLTESGNSNSAKRDAAIGDLRAALDPTKVFQLPDLRLSPGQLTTRGFMQHVVLGKSLAESYKRLLHGVHSPRNIYIRSTNYARTLQSAAGLILGMLPDIGGVGGGGGGPTAESSSSGLSSAIGDVTGEGTDLRDPRKSKVIINSFVNEEAEVMHGVGLKLSSHQVDAAGEKSIMGSCNKAVELARQQKAAFTTAPTVLSALSALYDAIPTGATGVSGDVSAESASGTAGTVAESSVRKKFVTDLADSALPHFCHNEELPCSSQGAGCMSEALLGQLAQQADRAFCDRYTGKNGGREGSKISIFPFLREVVAGLRAQIDGYNSAASSAKASSSQEASPLVLDMMESADASRVKLSVFSGHDTVIAPVLAALGAFTGKDCVWPPYASRIAFELWRPKQRQKARHGRGVTGSSAVPPASSDWRVRVVFDGKDITAQIPACAAETAQRGNKSTLKSRLCSLDALEGQLMGLLGNAATLDEACKM